jgi:hypothetical protein
VYSDDAGVVALVDREGHRTALSDGWISIHGIAWTTDGSETWFGGTKGVAVSGDGIFAVTPNGQLRAVIVGPTRYKVLDIASDGRVLISHDRDDKVVEARMAGSATPVDVSLRANSSSTWVADDGDSMLIADLAAAS